MNENMVDKWCYSTDGECYSGVSDTEAEAHGAAKFRIAEDAGYLGNITHDYWIAQHVHPLDTVRQDVGEDVLKMLNERIADEIAGDEIPLNMAPEDVSAFSGMIIDYVHKNCTVQRYGINNPVKYQYIIGSSGE